MYKRQIQSLSATVRYTDIKIAYKTNKNKLQNLNSSHNKDNTTTNGIYKIECQDCNKCYIGQTKKQLKKRYFEHLNSYKKPEIYKSNLATHAINTGHEFPDITNVTPVSYTHLDVYKRQGTTPCIFNFVV